MNYVREYWGRISSGEIVTSRRVKAVYGRLMQEMDAPSDDSAYYFDEETGERPILFIEQFCKQSQGTLGAALKLELFQKAFIQTLFGWLEKDTGYRRFRETLLLVARKNGKTTLLAAIALYLLVADYEGAAEIYSVATKKDQAKNPQDQSARARGKNFGGGGGTGITVTPVSFLVIGASGSVELLNVGADMPPAGPVESVASLIEKSPDILSRLKNVISSMKKDKNDVQDADTSAQEKDL